MSFEFVPEYFMFMLLQLECNFLNFIIQLFIVSICKYSWLSILNLSIATLLYTNFSPFYHTCQALLGILEIKFTDIKHLNLGLSNQGTSELAFVWERRDYDVGWSSQSLVLKLGYTYLGLHKNLQGGSIGINIKIVNIQILSFHIYSLKIQLQFRSLAGSIFPFFLSKCLLSVYKRKALFPSLAESLHAMF